jgi:hypothetical protein
MVLGFSFVDGHGVTVTVTFAQDADSYLHGNLEA